MRLMAYTHVNGMRSTRYPLQGLGCGCSPVASALRGLGLDIESFAVGGGIATAGLIGLAVGVATGYWIGGGGRSMRRNRRRRRN